MPEGPLAMPAAFPVPLTPTWAEEGDAAATPATPYALGAWEFFAGHLSAGGDADWIAIDLAAHEGVGLSVQGWGSTPVAGFGLVTALFDGAGGPLAIESGYSESASWIAFANAHDGPLRIYLEVAGFSDADSGGYVVSRVPSAGAGAALDVDVIADRLVADRQGWTLAPGAAVGVDLARLDPDGAAMARDALQAWARVTGLTFVETTLDRDAPAGIVFANAPDGAFTTLARDATGAIEAAWVTVPTDPGTGSDADGGPTWLAYLHEIGHALGLADAGGATALGPAYENDHWQMSVMSAHGQTGADQAASRAVPLTPMPADIAAMARLYGPPAELGAGDSLYGPAGTGGVYDDLAARAGGQAMTLVDLAGTDLLDLSSVRADQRIDLAPGAVSDIAGLVGNLVIAAGTVIEDARGGQGADRISGNAAANRLDGGAGADWLDGGDGADLLDGGPGNDDLAGGAGADEFVFRSLGGQDRVADFTDGEDRIRFADPAEPRVILEEGPEGTALVAADGTRMLLQGVAADRIGSDDFLWSGGKTLVFGTAAADDIEGTPGDDVIHGGSGSDSIRASAGNDVIDGGDGLDWLSLPVGSRSRIDLSTGQPQAMGGGQVTLRGIENLAGGQLGDTLTGSLASNVIDGMGGNDVIDGQGGMDRLIGGKGRDLISGGEDRVRDIFVYETIYDSKPGTQRDVIYDFQSRIDLIDLSAIDADIGRPGDQAFRFTGPRATAHAVWIYDIGRNLLLRGDVNGDARFDFEIELADISMLGLRDFLL